MNKRSEHEKNEVEEVEESQLRVSIDNVEVLRSFYKRGKEEKERERF